MVTMLFYSLTGSGVSAGLLGVAYFADIHHFSYFVVFQIMGGIMQVWIGSGGRTWSVAQDKAFLVI